MHFFQTMSFLWTLSNATMEKQRNSSRRGHPQSLQHPLERPEKKSKSRVCRQCGQHHSHHEPHLYNYVGEVDEDFMCQICLQPFVQPLDTPCGHTFCHVCIHNYLKVNPMCPLDRKPLNEMTCSPSNLVLKRYIYFSSSILIFSRIGRKMFCLRNRN